jgi:2-oxoisovalerate dehydrogenase E2 component (dihydrolipoyl transacylase)
VVHKIGGIQRIMVQTMNAANAIPHFGFNEEIVVDELVRLRRELKSVSEKRGIKLSYMPFIIKATSMALRFDFF